MKGFVVNELVKESTNSKCYIANKGNEKFFIKITNFPKKDTKTRLEVLKEIEILKKLNKHENIIKFEEYFHTGNYYQESIGIVTENMEMNLWEFIHIKNNKICERKCRKIINQIFKGVHFCHENYVTHHDIKLENITINSKNLQIKLIDFGMSTLSEDEKGISNLTDRKGTPLYVAPEVIISPTYDGRKSDIWSCGIVLFRLISGYFPFGENPNTLDDVFVSILNDLLLIPKCSRSLKNLIKKILIRNPDKRISMLEILNHKWFKSLWDKIFN